MTAKSINGKQLADGMIADISIALSEKIDANRPKNSPHLAVILVGNDPASEVYVSMKEKAANQAGIAVNTFRYPTLSEEALFGTITKLNHDPGIHGILVQFPLPEDPEKNLENKVVKWIDPQKDVDGLHPDNVTLRKEQLPTLYDITKGYFSRPVACTALGCMFMIKHTIGSADLGGKTAVVMGASRLGGDPIADLLKGAGADVKVITLDTPGGIEEHKAIAKTGDILVVAIGKPELVNQGYVKEGAIVIDVGIHQKPDNTLVGDVDVSDIINTASAYTPVPGGVGPMTVASLMFNTARCFYNQNDLLDNVFNTLPIGDNLSERETPKNADDDNNSIFLATN